MYTNKFRDPNLIEKLKELRSTDIDSFSRLILKCIIESPRFAIEDEAPSKVKLRALDSLRSYFESIEEYENCAKIKGIHDQIKSYGY